MANDRKQDQTNPGSKRSWRNQAVGDLIPKVTRQVMQKRGFAKADIMAHWADLVGQDLAPFCRPERLAYPRGKESGGLLHIRVDSAMALYLSHMKEELISRLNGFFGYRAIDDLILHQGAVGRDHLPEDAPAPASLSAEDQAKLDHQKDKFSDDDLGEALAKLGQAVIQTKKSR